MKKRVLFFIFVGAVAAGMMSCRQATPADYYHPFKNTVWQRFEPVRFEIPVSDTNTSWDIIFFLRHTRNYEYNTFDFNMILTTPSGEERIREFHLDIRDKNGLFRGVFTGDSCEVVLPLKKGIRFQKPGILRIEIETIVPRMEIPGISGAGIRMVPLR